MGKQCFVLVSGVFSYGLAMFVGMTFIANGDKLSVDFIAISAVASTIGGALIGIGVWHVQERQFRKASKPGPD
jgi:hypothetical protein